MTSNNGRARSNKDIFLLIDPLFDDMIQCEAILKQSDSPFARRNLVRATFAYFEGLVYSVKDRMVDSALAGESLRFTAGVLVNLMDEVPRPNRQGKLELEANRVPFLNSCAFLLRVLAESRGIDSGPFFSDNGWNQMQASLSMRHRITHPKQVEDLEISDSELENIRGAYRWLWDAIDTVIAGVFGADKP
jgi:hypothetical protein